jgi:hypothetical protein
MNIEQPLGSIAGLVTCHYSASLPATIQETPAAPNSPPVLTNWGCLTKVRSFPPFYCAPPRYLSLVRARAPEFDRVHHTFNPPIPLRVATLQLSSPPIAFIPVGIRPERLPVNNTPSPRAIRSSLPSLIRSSPSLWHRTQKLDPFPGSSHDIIHLDGRNSRCASHGCSPSPPFYRFLLLLQSRNAMPTFIAFARLCTRI